MVNGEKAVNFGDWLRVHPSEDLVIPLRLASRLFEEGDSRSALSLVIQLESAHPDEGSVCAARAALQHFAGFNRAAEHEMSHALALSQGDADIAIGLARLRLDLGLPTAAIEALGKAHDAGRDDAELQRLLGLAWGRLDRGSKARRHFDAAFDLAGPNSVDIRLEAVEDMMSGSHSLRTGKEARDWLASTIATAIEIAPSNAHARLLQGVLFEREGDIERALACYETACKLEPENALGWTFFALGLHKTRDSERFGGALSKALELERDRHLRKYLAALATNKGRGAESIARAQVPGIH